MSCGGSAPRDYEAKVAGSRALGDGSGLIKKIAEVVKNDKIKEISDLRDESDKSGMRLVIELKRGEVPEVVLNNLYKQTQLATTFGAILLAIDHGRPKVMNLKDLMTCYIEHRFEVLTRRTRFELREAEARAHILEGLLIALDLKPKRLELALQLGADLAINVAEEDAVAKVMELSDGYGLDVYIEATGAGPAVPQGLQMLRKLGTFVEFSVHAGPVAVDWSVIGDVKELNIHGAHLGPYSYPLAIQYLRDGTIDGASLVTHRYPLEQFH